MSTFPVQLLVVVDVCKKYACDCTIRMTTKPSQPIEKSTAGASLLAQVIVAKTADHLPLYRQEKIFERHGVDISRKTMGGWLAQCALAPEPRVEAVAGKSVVRGRVDPGIHRKMEDTLGIYEKPYDPEQPVLIHS
jgi:transposase